MNNEILTELKKDISSGGYMDKYYYAIKCNGYIKFGASLNPEVRITELQIGNPYKLKILVKILCLDSNRLESKARKNFKNNHIRGEWFKISDEIQNYIKDLKIIELEQKEDGLYE